MPHLVIEYSDTLEEKHSVEELMMACHQAANQSGQFTEKDIKVRAYPCGESLIAGKEKPFLHVTVKLLSGRDHKVKKALTTAVVEALSTSGVSVSSLSVEAVDIDRESYSKITE